MKLGGRLCPWCRYYNSVEERYCTRCNRWLGPSFLSGFFREITKVDLWATKLLGAISILVFAFEMVTAIRRGHFAIFSSVPISTLLRFGALANTLEWTEPWRALSSCFVHMSVLHVAMNMLMFVDLSRIAEREIGGARHIFLYVFTGIIGFFASTLWYSMTHAPYITAGASGAIFGVDGAVIASLYMKKNPEWKGILGRTIFYSFLFYFVLHTNQAAHLGGLASGFLLGIFFSKESRPWRHDIAFTIVAIFCMVLTLVSLVLPQFSPIWREAEEYEMMQKS